MALLGWASPLAFGLLSFLAAAHLPRSRGSKLPIPLLPLNPEAPTFPRAHSGQGWLWTVSSELGSGREKGVVDEQGRHREVGQKDRLVPTVWTRPRALGGEPAETLLGGLAREEGTAHGRSDPRPPPLGLQPLREPRAPWTVAHQAPLSLGFSRQEYWSGLPCPPPGDLPDPGTEPMSLMYPALAVW